MKEAIFNIETYLKANKLDNSPSWQEIKNALNELERLRKFRATFNAYELAKKQDFIAYENWQECEKNNDLYYKALCNIESLSISDNDELRKILERVLT